MPKIWTSILCLLILISIGEVCNAIPKNELKLGNLGLYCSLDYPSQVYGAPKRTKEYNEYLGGSRIHFYESFYGNESLSTLGTIEKGIIEITTTANNGIGTPSGIFVGTSTDTLFKTYGNPDYTRKENDAVIYEYNSHQTKSGYEDALIFKTLNGKIVAIHLSSGILSL